MFDFHMHSTVSFDGHDTPERMVQAAVDAGLKEICFTDHIDYDPLGVSTEQIFDTQVYNAAYEGLRRDGLKIRLGMEFGLFPDNQAGFREELKRRPFDFVLGSVHCAQGLDVYFPPFWEGKTVFEAERCYLEDTLVCVQNHDDFDVLAHLTYLGKARAHPARRPIDYDLHREVIDEILRVLAGKGKGLEMNTSGVDRCGVFFPEREFFVRFKELGGKIVTVGSDAHTYDRVGQYCRDACKILGDVFGYVCTYENRQPVFHKL